MCRGIVIWFRPWVNGSVTRLRKVGTIHLFLRMSLGLRVPPVPGRQKSQNVNFNPSCITRLLPEPTSGLPDATSGVAPPLPNPPGLEGSQPSCEPFAEPYGLAIMG